MKPLVRACIVAVPLFWASQANAEIRRSCCVPVPKWYGGASGSLVYLEDVDLEENISFVSTPETLTHAIGFGVAMQFGYRLTDTFRLELEGRYTQNELDEVDGTSPETTFGPGHYRAESYGFHLNGYYDFRNRSRYTPYLGAGIGTTYVKNPIYFYTTSPDAQANFKEWLLSYQFMGGFSYDVPDTPFEMFMQYRYTATAEGESTLSTIPGYKVNFKNSSHNVELGGRLLF